MNETHDAIINDKMFYEIAENKNPNIDGLANALKESNISYYKKRSNSELIAELKETVKDLNAYDLKQLNKLMME